jgi:hypothetical protein
MGGQYMDHRQHTRVHAATWLMSPLVPSAEKLKIGLRTLFSYRHFQLRRDLMHNKETKNYCYAFRY